MNKIYNTDCLIGMKEIPDKSIDMLLTDLPYGCLECEWDKPIDLAAFWAQANRVIKENGAMVLTATLKFAVELINSNKKYFRYDLIWEKTLPVGFPNANRQPLRSHELILVFYKRMSVYNPQGLIEIPTKNVLRQKKFSDKEYAYPARSLNKPYIQKYTGYPRSVLKFSNGNNRTVHPTQKPLELFKYLIKTYTNDGGTVLDPCIGSGTTAIACLETGRNYIGFEISEKYFKIAGERIDGFVKI